MYKIRFPHFTLNRSKLNVQNTQFCYDIFIFEADSRFLKSRSTYKRPKKRIPIERIDQPLKNLEGQSQVSVASRLQRPVGGKRTVCNVQTGRGSRVNYSEKSRGGRERSRADLPGT